MLNGEEKYRKQNNHPFGENVSSQVRHDVSEVDNKLC